MPACNTCFPNFGFPATGQLATHDRSRPAILAALHRIVGVPPNQILTLDQEEKLMMLEHVIVNDSLHIHDPGFAFLLPEPQRSAAIARDRGHERTTCVYWALAHGGAHERTCPDGGAPDVAMHRLFLAQSALVGFPTCLVSSTVEEAAGDAITGRIAQSELRSMPAHQQRGTNLPQEGGATGGGAPGGGGGGGGRA